MKNLFYVIILSLFTIGFAHADQHDDFMQLIKDYEADTIRIANEGE